MKKVIVLKKKEGETPLESIGVFCRKHKKYKGVPMTYAGRLDPMASGLLLVLVGDECKNKEKYLKLDKEYEFEVLFGFATDTYDILGKVVNSSILQNDKMLIKQIKSNLKFFRGKFTQKYPIYSSKTVKGKPLFEYGRSGVEVEVPEREVHVKNLSFLGLKKVTSKNLLENIEKRISKVNGDFRQEEIISIWQQELKDRKVNFCIGSFKIKCSSGTYVRGIANSLGERLGTPSLAYRICRTRIGKWVEAV